jgi:hypothetical protein
MKKPGMGADVAGRHHRPRRGDDRSIRARLLGVLGREEWAWMWPEDKSSATVSCIFGFPRMSHWRRGRRCVAAERIPGVRGVTEHDVIEFQPRRPSPRVRNGREAPRLQTFQASLRAARFDRQESSAATRQLIFDLPSKRLSRDRAN